LQNFTSPQNGNDQERSTWWTSDPTKNYKMTRYVKNLEYKAKNKPNGKPNDKPPIEEKK
jgi:hypothetical protein